MVLKNMQKIMPILFFTITREVYAGHRNLGRQRKGPQRRNAITGFSIPIS